MDNLTGYDSSAISWMHPSGSSTVELQENKALGLMEVEDHRPLAHKIADLAKAFFNNIRTCAIRILWRLSAKPLQFPAANCIQGAYVYPKDSLPWNQSGESQGLYLFIHGLKGSPTHWNEYCKEIRQNDPEAHIFVPQVPLEGNCDLETAAKPILDVLEDYLKKFPGKPVALVGTSNGGRIAEYIESRVNPELLGVSHLSVVSLAGVHYGTKLMDQVKKMGLLFLTGVNKKLADEFLYGSGPAKQNLTLWQNRQGIWARQNRAVRHLFCATTEDEQVRGNESSLPYHNASLCAYKVVHGHSHTSIVDGVRNDVMEWLFRPQLSFSNV